MIDLIFALSEILIVVSYLFRDILILRIITMMGMTGYVIGAVIAGYHEAGMKALIFFSALSVLVNAVQIMQLITERTPLFLPDEAKNIYKEMFTTMTANEFLKLYKLSCNKTYTKGEILAKQDEPITELIAIKKGEASINKNEKRIAKIGQGFFVGEMSFLTGNLATATVVADKDIECLIWEKAKLVELERKNAELYGKLKQDIAINLVKKINQSTS